MNRGRPNGISVAATIKRDADLVQRAAAGESERSLALRYGITRQRVKQIVGGDGAHNETDDERRLRWDETQEDRAHSFALDMVEAGSPVSAELWRRWFVGGNPDAVRSG